MGDFASVTHPGAQPHRITLEPAQYLVAAYVTLIFAGALVLCLPQASVGEPLTFVDALFMAASAISVTGLSVVSVACDLTRFGHVVLLLLMEVGALGIMTMSTLFFLILGRRIRLRDRIMLRQDLNHNLFSGLVRLVRSVVLLTGAFQLAGALILFAALRPQYAWNDAAFFALFHSVSAFANTGFDLFGDSLTGLKGNLPFTATIAGLGIAGSLGFSVWAELFAYPSTRSLSLFARVVLRTSVFLLALGSLLYVALEWGNPATLGALGPAQRLWNAFFLSGSTRSVGFTTVPVGAMSETALLLSIALMAIGGAPGSTAGGIKITTLATVVAAVRATLLGQSEVNLMGRRLPPDAIFKAVVVTAAFGGVLFLGIAGLTLTEEAPFLDVLFEATSALATAGLSTGLTPELSEGGKLILVTMMFAGRVGLLTLALALGARSRGRERFRLPEEGMPVG